MKMLLRFNCGMDRVICGVECDAKGIADDLKDVAIVQFHRGAQDGMMTIAQAFPLLRVFLRKFGRAFDVGEEKGHGAGGRIHSCLKSNFKTL